jgi:hypothetical protein
LDKKYKKSISESNSLGVRLLRTCPLQKASLLEFTDRF